MAIREVCPTCNRPFPVFAKRACVICGTKFNPSGLTNVCCSRLCQRVHLGNFKTRFWSRVNKEGPIAPGMKTRCWLWTGRLEANGYARVKREDSRQQVSVHRAAWELQHGEVSDGKCVLHKCDVRHCVRHLFLGTHQDNMHDMHRKGRARQVHGPQHGRSKLTEEQVRDMRKRKDNGASISELSYDFRISYMQVKRICTGERWAYLQTRS